MLVASDESIGSASLSLPPTKGKISMALIFGGCPVSFTVSVAFLGIAYLRYRLT